MRPIRTGLLQGTVSIGTHPPRGGGTSFAGGEWNTPTFSSMPSRKKPHDAAVTRGTPHEDGGSIFIQIPATPPGICPWTAHGEVYQTSEAVGLMASPQQSPILRNV